MKYMQLFYLTGSGMFPLDMLNLDRCWPSGLEDVLEIAKALGISGDRPATWSVRLSRYTMYKTDLPSIGRWATYGCKILTIHTKGL